MADVIIERKPTDEELRNYVPVGLQTVEKKFKQMRIAKEQEYVKKHEPFCARCADLDFQDVWESKKKEMERKVGYNAMDQVKVEFKFPDLTRYGDKNRFDLKGKSPIIREIVTDGVRVPKLVGHYHEYICKDRGCGRAVEVPLPELDFTSEKKDKAA